MRKNLFITSSLIIVLAAASAFLGIFRSDLYHDNAFVKTAWLANDWVTLLVAIPALLMTMILSRRKEIKAELIWIGLLGYFFYNYAFYLFGAVFNSLFLPYVFICSLSFFSILGFFSILPVHTLVFEPKTTRWVNVFLLLLSVMLCLIEIPPCIQFVTAGKIPELNLKTGHPTNIVYALDLTFIVPCMLIAAILNFRKNVWGGVLSIFMLVKASTYGLVLISGTILLIHKGETDPLFPVWIFITAGGIFGSWLMLKNLKTGLPASNPHNLR